MIGIVIASHGEFCVGLKGTTEMFRRRNREL